MPEAVVFADRQGVIRLWNRAAQTVFGYAADEALGQSLDLIVNVWRGRVVHPAVADALGEPATAIPGLVAPTWC